MAVSLYWRREVSKHASAHMQSAVDVVPVSVTAPGAVVTAPGAWPCHGRATRSPAAAAAGARAAGARGGARLAGHGARVRLQRLAPLPPAVAASCYHSEQALLAIAIACGTARRALLAIAVACGIVGGSGAFRRKSRVCNCTSNCISMHQAHDGGRADALLHTSL